MIYVLKNWDGYDGESIDSVWDIKHKDVESKYKEFMIEESEILGIVINPHWLNIMSHNPHHNFLTETEYKKAKKAWNKILQKQSIKWFLREILKARELDFKDIYL